MFIDLKQLFDIVDEKRGINHDLDMSHITLGASAPFITPVHIAGEIKNRAGIVTLAYAASFTLSVSCDRCLDDFTRDYSYSFEHTLVPQLNAEYSDELILVENSKLDLDELVTSDVLLSLPTKFLCKDECKGLCPSCGVNLNNTDCNCSRKQCDIRLEALRELL